MPITTAQFNDLVKNAKVQWAEARQNPEFPYVRKQLAKVVSVDEATSEHSSVSSVETARRRNEGDEAYTGSVKQGYTKNFAQAEIALKAEVTKKLRRFDKYEEIMRRMRMMGAGADRRMEIDIASLLFYAWATSYVSMDGETVTTATPDGLALIDNAHTAKNSAATFSNEIGTTHSPISVSVLEALQQLGNKFIDDSDGRAMPSMFDTIITANHAPTIHTVERIIGSDKLAETTDNDKNTFKGKYKHLIVPYLNINPATQEYDSTRDKYVFVANLGERNKFRMEVAQDVMFEAPEKVFDTSTWKFLTTAYYDFGTLGANFIAGTKGDGSAV